MFHGNFDDLFNWNDHFFFHYPIDIQRLLDDVLLYHWPFCDLFDIHLYDLVHILDFFYYVVLVNLLFNNAINILFDHSFLWSFDYAVDGNLDYLLYQVDLFNRHCLLVIHFLLDYLWHLLFDHSLSIYGVLFDVLHWDIDFLFIDNLLLDYLINLPLYNPLNRNVLVYNHFFDRFYRAFDNTLMQNFTFDDLLNDLFFLFDLFDFVVDYLFFRDLHDLLVIVFVYDRLLLNPFDRPLYDVFNWPLNDLLDLDLHGTLNHILLGNFHLLLNVLLEDPHLRRHNLIVFILAYILFIYFNDVFYVLGVFVWHLDLLLDKLLNRHFYHLIDIDRLLNIPLNRHFDYALDRNLNDLVIRTFDYNIRKHILLYDLFNRGFVYDIIRDLDLLVHWNWLFDYDLDVLVNKDFVDLRFLCPCVYVPVLVFLLKGRPKLLLFHSIFANTKVWIFMHIPAYFIRLSFDQINHSWLHWP